MRCSPLIALLVAGTAVARPADEPPTRPDGFRATLYDKAGGELFWQRSTDDRGAVRGYEVTRNGQSLGIRDALSFYDPTLRPDTPYTFTVVAIDNAGQRSSVATTTLGGGTNPPPANDGPDAPAGLRSDVYSRRSAELFWQREPAALALRYEIRRDGQVVGTTNGVSHYTNALAAGTDHVFEVVAIDREGRRSAPARTTVRTAGEGASTPPAANAPDAPAELRADVYSTRSAELFWKREPAALALRYEIRRDDRIVGTTDGISYYTSDLEPGTDHAFEVVAIGRDGARSRPAALLVGTSGTPAPPTLEPLEPPRNLRASVYSRRAAELFWDRSATLLAPRYEIRRDGDVIGTTNGTSFYDDVLAGGTAYTYDVVTLDGGRRSSASTVTLANAGTPPRPANDPFAEPDPNGATALARLGYPAARDLALELVSGAYLGLYLDVDEAVRSRVTGTDGTERTERCPGGGSARGSAFAFSFATVVLDDCVIEGRTLSGSVEWEQERFPIATGGVARLTIRFDALRIDAGEAGTLDVTGSFERGEGSGQNERCNRYENAGDGVRIASARLERDGEVSLVTDARYAQSEDRRDFGPPGDDTTPCTTVRTRELDGEASVVSTRFGTDAATIAIRADDAGDASDSVFEADFGDGSALVVTATPGAGEDVRVDLASGGAAVSFTDDSPFEPRAYGIALD